MGSHDKNRAVPMITSKSRFERITGVQDPDTIVLFSEHPFPPEFPHVGYELAKEWVEKGRGAVTGDQS